MRLVVTYTLTLAAGMLVAFVLAFLVGLIFPRATVPVFIVLTLWWSWQGWKDRKSTRLNSSHLVISYAVFCLKKKKNILHYVIYHHLISPLYFPHSHPLSLCCTHNSSYYTTFIL